MVNARTLQLEVAGSNPNNTFYSPIFSLLSHISPINVMMMLY